MTENDSSRIDMGASGDVSIGKDVVGRDKSETTASNQNVFHFHFLSQLQPPIAQQDSFGAFGLAGTTNRQKLIGINDRLISLFGYETNGKRDSIFWTEPQQYYAQPDNQARQVLEGAFAKWQTYKRPFTLDEILQGKWVKASDNGNSFVVSFHRDGSLTEIGLFDQGVPWKGTWRLVGAILRMNVGNYELDIVASYYGSMHSGIEFYSGGLVPDAYFKVIHLQE